MAKSPGQKLKLLYLEKILLERTDENHPMTLSELSEALAAYGITAERKSLYSDIEQLRNFGLDIVGQKTRSYGYYVGSRLFELPELKMMVDAVQSAKFITLKKSNELIKKLETLCSRHDAQMLQRQVYVQNRVKTMNESIYYNVDKISMGIAESKQISFLYFEYNIYKERVPRKNGERYLVSPYALCWDDENYYLIAYDGAAKKIKHYRVDKMMNIRVEKQPREGEEAASRLDVAAYTKSVFGMYGGSPADVTLRFENSLVGVVIDRFGKEVSIRPDGPEHFIASVRVEQSPIFLGWLFQFGDRVQVLSPQTVIDQLRRYAERLLKQYEGGRI